MYDNTGESSRGLEHMKSRAILEKLRQNYEDVVHAVLDAQERQNRTGFYDDNAIALASSKHTKWARDRATMAGAADAAAVAVLEFVNSRVSSKCSPPTFSPIGRKEKRLENKSLALRGGVIEMRSLVETMSA